MRNKKKTQPRTRIKQGEKLITFWGFTCVMVLVRFIELLKSRLYEDSSDWFWRRIEKKYALQVEHQLGQGRHWIFINELDRERLNIQWKFWLIDLMNSKWMCWNGHLTYQILIQSRIFGVNLKFMLTGGDQKYCLNWKLNARKNGLRIL